MKYSITFYCYKLEENELSISISKKDGIYLLTKTYETNNLEDYYPPLIKEVSFIHYIPMLHYLIDTFDEFYKENVTCMPYSIKKIPLDYYLRDICNMSIERYTQLANEANIKMVYSKFLYNYSIIKDIKEKINKAIFRLLVIKIQKENIKYLQALFICSDVIVKFI